MEDPSPVDATASPPRLQEFDADIRRLGVKGGNTEPERRIAMAGLLATVVGVIMVVVGFVGVRGSDSQLAQGDNMAMMWLGLTIAIVGAVLWARYSFSRYLRYWLVRQIFEDRAQTDRIVEAIERRAP